MVTRHEPSKPPAEGRRRHHQQPRLLFNGLINEQTFIQEASPLAKAYDRLCPVFDLSKAEAAHEELRPYLVRLCQELHWKLQANTLRIAFDSPLVTSSAVDSVWDSDCQSVYLPIRLPPATLQRARPEESPGHVGIRIPALTRKQLQLLEESGERDPLEFLRSPRRYVSSGVALKSTWKLVNNALQQLSAKYDQDFVIHDLALDKLEGVINLTLTVNSRYLNSKLATPRPNRDGDEDDDDEEDEDADVGGIEAATFNFVGHDDATEGEKEEDEQEEAEQEEDEHEEDEPHCDSSASASADRRDRRHRRVEEPPVTTRQLRLRLSPALQHPTDEQALLTTQPFEFAAQRASHPDLWTVRYPAEEALLLRSLTAADRGLRLRAWRGLTDFFAAQPELRCLGRDALKHSMFHLAESEVDHVGVRWQRAPLEEYVAELLGCLRDFLADGRLPHFYYKEVDVLQALPAHQRRSCALKIDFFLRKETALLRAVQRSADARQGALQGLREEDEEEEGGR